MTSKIIDIHPHIFSRDTVRYPVTPIGGERSDWSKERSVTIEELVAEMDEARVDKAAIVHSSTTYGFNSDVVVDGIAQYPGRLTGVFSVNITEPDAPERMRYWLSKGMTGMRIYARGSKIKEAWLSIDDPANAAAWEAAAELGISVALNVHARDAGLEQIRNVATRYPTVPVVIDHLGRPPIADGPPYLAASDYFRLSELPNIYLKYTFSGLTSMLKEKAAAETFIPKLVSVFGASRIAWGSNYPSAPGTLAEIVASAQGACAGLSDEDRSWIFAKTAQHLYPVLKD